MTLNWQPQVGPVTYYYQPNDTSRDNQLYNFMLPLETDPNDPKSRYELTEVRGNLTIGIGFDLVAGNLTDRTVVLDAMGFNATMVNYYLGHSTADASWNDDQTQEWNYLNEVYAAIYASDKGGVNAVMAARSAQYSQPGKNSFKDYVDAGATSPQRGTFAFKTEAEIYAAFVKIYPTYDPTLVSLFSALNSDSGFSGSREDEALLDLNFNMGIGRSSLLARAIITDNNRAEAWYEIRFDSNKGWNTQDIKLGAGGLAKRRYFQSDLFGLFGNYSSPTLGEAINAYQVLTNHRAGSTGMLAYEAKFGDDPNGNSPETPSSYIRMAQTVGGGPVTVYTLAQSYDVAFRLIQSSVLNYLSAALPAIQLDTAGRPDNSSSPFYIRSTNLLLGEKSGQTVTAVGDLSNGSNKILIGSLFNGANEKLIGGAGNEILIQGSGSGEILEAGSGSETLVGGQTYAANLGFGAAGASTLVAGTGFDTFVFAAPSGAAVTETIVANGTNRRGSIEILNGQVDTLGGSAQQQLQAIPHKIDEWSTDGSSSGLIYKFNRDTNELLITQSGAGSLGSSTIDIKNFNLPAAESTGELGIFLQQQASLNPGASPQISRAAEGASSPFAAGSVQTYTFAVDAPTSSAQTVTITLSGCIASDFNVQLGASTVPLNVDGTFNVTLSPGQTSVSFALQDVTKNDGKSDIASGATLQLAAKYANPDANAAALQAPALKLNYVGRAPDTAPAPKAMTAITGSAGTPSTTGKYFGDGGNDQVLASFTDNDIELQNSINDSIVGSAGKNTIVGGSGNDVIALHGTHDLVDLGTGHNTVTGSSTSQDTIVSDAGDAIINAHNAIDVILLGSGNNEIYADSQTSLANAISQLGAATTTSQLASATAMGKKGGLISQLAGATATGQKGDLISVLDGNDTIVGGLGNDLINVGSGHTVVVMGPGEDTFLGGWDLTDGGGAWSTKNDPNGVIEVLNVVASPEAFTSSYPQPYNGGDCIIDGASVHNGPSNETVFGGSGNDIILLGNGSNFVDAGSGNTYVHGGMGNDTIIGGAGTDTLLGGGGNTYIEAGSGDQRIWGGDGNNTIIGGSGHSTISSASIDSQIAVNGRWANDTLSTNYVFGGAGNNVIFGSAGHDTLVAGSGSSTLQGGLGSEYIVGGTGKDLLIGGDGFDTLVAGSGANTLQAGSGATASSWLYGGEGSDLIEGGGGQNYLWAGDGGVAGNATTVMGSASDASSSTTINGGLGVDLLQGGAGSTVIYAGDGGTAQAAASVVATTGATTIYGGSGVDLIQGGTNTCVLYAGDGGYDGSATTVLGMSGIATLWGGAGTDILWDGMSGHDLIVGGSGTATLAGMNQDTLIAGSGNDLLQNLGGNVTVVLGANFGEAAVQVNAGGTDNLVFTGDVTAASLTATVGWDSAATAYLSLQSADGNANIQGALTGGLKSVSFAGQGSLSVTTLMTTLFKRDQTFTSNGRSVQVAVGANETITANISAGGFETVSAWGDNETISGSGSNGVVYSTGSAAHIAGGYWASSITAAGANAVVTTEGSPVTLAGANSIVTSSYSGGSLTASGTGDTLVGGVGNYSTNFCVNDSSTTVVSNNLSHGDFITSTVNFALPTNGSINVLTLSGKANIVGTANAGADTLTAGDGIDTLVSGTGVDVLIGGTNSTTFVVNNSADVLMYEGGFNSAVSSVNFVLPYGINVLTLTGNAALSGKANDRSDTLISNTGVDTLTGGGGHDLFVVNNAADVIIEASSAANDTLQSSLSTTLSANVNTLVLTGAAALTGQANSGNDTLVSNSGVDTLTGGAGNDTFIINNAADVVKGASATSSNTIVASVNVTLPVNVNTLTLTGTAALQATGNAAADIIRANDGNDTLTAVSTAAATTLIGGAGNDLFVVNNTADVVQVASTTSHDTIQSSVNFTAVAHVDTLVLTGSANLQATATAAGETIISNSGIDTLVGGSGHDVFIVNNAADVLLNISATDTILSAISLTVPSSSNSFIATGSANLSITTNSGNNSVVGNGGNDTLTATSGQDTLVAGTGIDTFVAGTGNDLFIVNNVADVVSVAGAHGADTIQSSVNWTLQSGVNTLALAGSANLRGQATSGNNLIIGNAGNDTLIAGSGSDTLMAGSGLATLVGGAGADTFVINNVADTIQGISATLGNAVVSSVNYAMQANVSSLTLTGSANLVGTGNASSHVIVGNAGNDTLIAGSGAARLIGGTGADLFIVNSALDVVVEPNYDSKGFADTIQSSASYTLPGGVNNLVLTGSANLVARGNQDADSIIGNAGNDTLQAGSGDDTLVSGTGVTVLQGGAGNDTFVVNNAADTIINVSSNNNVLMSSVSITLPTNINTLLLTGSANLVGTSNGGDDLLKGNAGADKLVALGGNDTLVAGGGIATLVGGTGNDTFVVNNTADIVTAGSTTNALFSSATFVLPAHVDSLTLTGAANISGTGNGDADTLTAGGGNDTLIAGSGVAVMNGGTGPTTFVVNNVADVVQNASAAVANALQSSVNFTLPTNVNMLTLTGTGAITGTGNAASDTLVGNAGAATLVSGSGNDLFILGSTGNKVSNAYTTNSDTLQSAFNTALVANVNTLVLTGSAALTGQANSGNDTLVSNSGVDTFTGGVGNDTFILNNAGDVVQGASATSNNTIVASVNVTLPVNVNTLTLTGTAALQATGNAAADILRANDGDDTLTAVSTAAATTLVGGAGNDVFVVNNSADVIQSASMSSHDTILSSATFTAATNVNTLVLTGSANLQATANGAGDTLVSNSGVDTLVGGAGKDVFVVNNSADVLLNVGAGDTIESSVNYSVSVPGVAFVLIGSANITGSVSGSGDTLGAGLGVDTLTATAPGQTLTGGASGDVFVVNIATDVVVQPYFANPSTLVSGIAFPLPADVDTLVLTGSANLTATGNSDDSNVLYANAGNDLLTASAYYTTIVGGSGIDTLRAGVGENVIYAGSGGTVSQPTQLLGNASAGAFAQSTLYGGTGADLILGGTGTDVIYAGTGGSTIQSGSGYDTIYGNNNAVISDTLSGADLLVAGSGAETLSGFGADTLVSGSGNDLLEGNGGGGPIHYLINPGFGQVTLGAFYRTNVENIEFAAGIAPTDLSVSVTLPYGTYSPTLLLSSGTGSIQVPQAFEPGMGLTFNFAGTGPESLAQLMNASGLGKVVLPSGANNYIVSTGDGQAVAGNGSTVDLYAFGNGDSVSNATAIYAYGNGDTLTGVGSSALMLGNNGLVNANTAASIEVVGANDTIIASASGASIALSSPQAATTVIQAAAGLTGVSISSDVSWVLPTNVQALTLNGGFNGLTGSSNAQGGTLTANGDHDTLIGGAGTDLLIAMGANDVLVGGSGAESYILEYSSDSIQAGSGNASRDTVTTFFSYALGTTANTLFLEGNHAIGTANDGDDLLVVAQGGSGDTLIGGAGNDTLSTMYYSAATMVGGWGNTTFVVHSIDTVIDASTTSSNTLRTNGNGNFVLPTNVNTMVLTSSGISGTANSGNDLMTIDSDPGSGNSGSDTLVAGSGNDTLAAGATSGNTFVFNAGFGHDHITGTSTGDTITFGAGITQGSLTFSAVPGTGGAPADLVISSAGGGSITVQGGAVPGAINAVNFAGGGSFTMGQLLAPAGRSTVVGATGNLILSSSNSDSIVGGAGSDTIYAWGSADTLSAGSGGAVIDASGAGDLVTGGSGIDRLQASGANTTLVGGAGHETFVVGDSSIQVQVSAGNANNTVVASVSYAVPTGVTNMSLVGGPDSNLTATANGLDDIITGGAGTNTFIAGSGTDTFIAGSGSNTFYVNNSNDVIQAAGNGSQNTVWSTASFTLPENVDVLNLNGTNLVGIGNDQNDNMIGGNQDTLISGSGVDTLSGGVWSTLVINNSADSISTLGGASTVEAAVNYTYTGAVGGFTLQLIGSADLTAIDQGTGNSLALVGNAGNDLLIGRSGSHVTSGTGVDTLEAAAGPGGYVVFTINNAADVVVGVAGGDNVIVSNVSYAMPAFGTALHLNAPNIVGTGNSESGGTLLADAGSDTLVAGTGAQTLTSNTTYNSTSNFNTLVVGSGYDSLTADGGDTLIFNPGFGNSEESYDPLASRALNVHFGAGVNPGDLVASAVTGSDGRAALTISAGTGTTTLDGALSAGPGMPYQFQFAGGPTLSLSQFLAQVPVSDATTTTASGPLILVGDANIATFGDSDNDTILVTGAGDTLTGGSGNQVLEAMGTADSVIGGSNADTLMAFGTNDTLVGGSAPDLFVAGTGATAVFVINNSADTFQVKTSPGADTIDSSVTYALPTGINKLVLTGSAALKGSANNGADTLISNSGVDTLVGGTGADLFVLNNALDVVTVGLTHGVDTIQASFNDTLAANVATLVLTGSAALIGTGNLIADTLRANDGGDTLVAGTGAATMVGGAGNDLFMVNSASDSVQSAAGAGIDTISSTATFTLPTNVNTLVLTGAGSIKGTGNAANDLLTAATSTGKVTLVAGNGTDTLVSGAGIDSLVGGTGNDLFIINNASDVVTVTSTSVADTIQSSVNATLAANVRMLVLTGSTGVTGSGNSLADTIYGNAGSDTLSAGSGLATLIGGAGNNKFVVNNANDVVVSNSTTHSDTISSSAAAYTLPTNVNTLVLTGASAISGTGNAANDMITASTSTGAVTLNAGNGADTLVAGSGADVLVSGTGIDSLVGGTGNDLFILKNSADTVTVGGTHGADTIQASFNDTLAANVTTLVLTGSSALMGTGNGLPDTLVANSGNDTLVASTGVAKMIGGTGNDLFIVNATADVVAVASSTGADTIQSSVSYTLPANVQTLRLTGTTALTGTAGATTASLVVGNTGADTLNGGAAVSVLEAGSAGAQVLKAVGNQAALLGGGAANTITGGAYKDFYAAGKIADTITGGATANVIAVNKGDGATVLTPTTGASNVLSLGAGIDTEALTFTKSSNNLVLSDGVAGDSITFTNWFLSASNQTTKTLQVIESASASYNALGTDALRNKPVEEFNFTTLVSQFTAAGWPSGWALSQKEAADTIASSATAAYGGDLAYYFGKNGNLTGMNLAASVSTLTNASYATGLQTIDAWSGISTGASPLNVSGSSNAAVQGVATVSATSARRVRIEPFERHETGPGYVTAATLLAATKPGQESATREATVRHQWFGDAWSAMHHKLDEDATAHLAHGAEDFHSSGLSSGVLPVLAASGGDAHADPRRRVALPANHMAA